MTDFYQKNYKAYHEKTFSIDPSSFLEPLARRLPTEAFILDVGCGSGRDLLWMKNKGFEVIGFERSLELAELARENAGCEVIEGDFETYDFSTIMVDAVMLIGALVHTPYERFAEVLKNITASIPKHGNVVTRISHGSERLRNKALQPEDVVFYFED